MTILPPPLTCRHLAVIAGLARGHSYAQIGRHLHLSDQSVKGHIRDITQATGAHGATVIVDWAYRHGLMDGLRAEPRQLVDLRERDLRVLELIAAGLTTEETARKLGIGHAAVKGNIARLSGEFGATGRPHLVALAHQQGLLGDETRGVAA
ncbi:LuxR C-terminal-related transcriptional regulator [Streptomyces sp. CBMA152]|uniref:LuxR C-terminal-related transcriptional regulator n=1 Tax=Streptomyces sp. CBMA152 TaxID=1896312 RepID=UPI001660F8BA|nr:LuxR C-terminal-related transcriptional regulator [Streptomyces sp. CBMA152]MBD0743526.1 hypothetical protein [Streptomyces sp. CBMA152]